MHPFGLHLHPRDREVIAYLATHRFTTTERLREKFWRTSDQSNTHHPRLRNLAAEGLIAPLIGDGNSRLGYQITAKGLRTITDHPGGWAPTPSRKTVTTS